MVDTGSGRLHFSTADDEKLYLFILQEFERPNPDAKYPFGNSIWRLAEQKGITKHSYQSMLGRFKKILVPSLDDTVLLTETQKQQLGAHLSLVLKSKTVSRQSKSVEEASAQDDEFSNVSSEQDNHSESDETANAHEHGPDSGNDLSDAGNDADALEEEENGQRSAESDSDYGSRENVDDVAESCVATWTEPPTLDQQQSGEKDGTEPFIIEENHGEEDVIIEEENQVEAEQQELRSGQTAVRQKETRMKFTRGEDIRMLEFLAQEIKTHNPDADAMKGDQIWQLAAKNGITTRSFQSMRDRVRRNLLPNLKDLEHIPDDLKTFLLKRIAMWELPPHNMRRGNLPREPREPKTPHVVNVRRKEPSRKSKKKPKTPSVVGSETSDLSDADANDEAMPRRKRIKVVVEVEERADSPGKPQASISADTVCSVLFSMTMDGFIDSDQTVKDFQGKVDKLAYLAKKYKVPLTEVLRITEAVEQKNLREVEKVLVEGLEK